MVNKKRLYYLLVAISSCVLVFFIIDGTQFISNLCNREYHYHVIDQTSPETREALRQEAIRDSLGKIEMMKHLDNLRAQMAGRHIDGYDFVEAHDTVNAWDQGYNLIITRNDSVKFRTTVEAADSNGVNYRLYRLIPNGRDQVIVEEYTGGMGCCYLYWIFDMSDSLTTLYHSDGIQTEFGMLEHVDDFDHDGYLEFTQIISPFDSFDGLCNLCTPCAIAVFKYSKRTGHYEIANKSFPSVVLEGIEQKESEVKIFLDTARAVDEDPSKPLLSKVLDVLIHYVYAGQDSVGWAYFDKNYVLPDKAEMKRKIQTVFRKEVVYKELYQSRGGT